MHETRVNSVCQISAVCEILVLISLGADPAGPVSVADRSRSGRVRCSRWSTVPVSRFLKFIVEDSNMLVHGAVLLRGQAYDRSEVDQ
jgi:hypothetical protein